MTISLRVTEEENELIKNYAILNNTTVSEAIRQAIMEKIEDDYDLKAFYKAYEDYKNDKTTYSLDEVKKELDL